MIRSEIRSEIRIRSETPKRRYEARYEASLLQDTNISSEISMCETPPAVASSGYEATKLPALSTPPTRLKSDDISTVSYSTRSGSPFGVRSASEDTLGTDQQSPTGKCEDDSDEENDYDAFLREMAGSFEATYDDDDEESDEDDTVTQSDRNTKHSENGGEDYNELFREMSGSFKSADEGEVEGKDDALDDYNAFLREMAGSFEASNDDEESVADFDEKPGSEKSTPGLQEKLGNQKTLKVPQSPLVQVPQSPLWQGSQVVRLANGELKHLDDRPPVLDSYDMNAATASLDPPSLELPQATYETQRMELEEAIKLHEKQATALLTFSRKRHVSERLRSHYGRVGLELLAELRRLKDELDQLIQDQQLTCL